MFPHIYDDILLLLLSGPIHQIDRRFIDFKIMILSRQSEKVVYVIRRREIKQSKIFIWKPINHISSGSFPG